MSHGGALGVKKLNSATALIQIQPRRLPHGDYVLHRFGCSQENDQLLREGRQWPYLRRRLDTRHATRPGHVDEDASAAVDGGHGSDHLHGLDLRSSQASCRCREGGASPDAACHRRAQEKERSHRCQNDRRLGPSGADGATERKLPMPPSNCFETGRSSHTQSSVRSFGAETANGCLVLDRRGTTAERREGELERPEDFCLRSSQAHQESSCPLDKDLSWTSANRRCGPRCHLSDRGWITAYSEVL